MWADRVGTIQPFRVMEIIARAKALEAEGLRVVHFEVGEPDFTTAEPIVTAGQRALAQGLTHYSVATGIEPLREAIAARYRQLGAEIDPARVVITSGASGGLTLLAALLLNPGDELLIADPGYPCNEVFAHLVGGAPVPVAVRPENGYQPTVADVERCWTDRSRAALFASPANPTGTVMDVATFHDIRHFIAARDGALIVDEIYQGIELAELPYNTLLAEADDVLILNSFSKYFGMTGWRLGWIVIPDKAVDGVTKLAQNLFIAPSTPAQYAALAAFTPEAEAVHQHRVLLFRQRAKQLIDGLQALGFQLPVAPQGAFYAYVDVSHTGLDSQTFCQRMLEEYQVAITPGLDFGAVAADRFVRFAFTTDEDSIALGLQRLEQALSAWAVP